ncbi:MAG: peptidoglycan DD-metalloendopeptidase family protein [Deltaproteobacteria bacterium]|nr:peptidoglycan DD-metalloendopeptidase family protein [Deltaproteobacteria bacterium]
MIDPVLTSATLPPSSGKPRIGRWCRHALAIAAVTLAVGFAAQAGNTFELAQKTAPDATTLREQRITKLVAGGDTLPRLLTDLGVPEEARYRWHFAVAKELGVNNVLKEGDTVHFYFTSSWGSSDLGRLTALSIERAGLGRVSWEYKGGELVYHREKDPRPMVAAPEPPSPDEKPAEHATAQTSPKPEAEPARAPSPATASTAGEPAVKPVTHVLRKGQTLGRVLRRHGVSVNAQQPWIKAIGKTYSLKRLYPGRKIVLYFVGTASGDGGGRDLRALQIESRRGDLLTWQWADGRIVYRGRNHPIVPGDLVAAPKPAVKAKPAKAPERTAATQPTASKSPVSASEPSPPIRSFEPLDKVTRTIRRGQTLGRIFRRLGISGKEAEEWFEAVDRQYPVTRLKPGQRLHLYLEAASTRRRGAGLKAIELEVKKGRNLSWERVGKVVRFGRGPVPGRGQGSPTGVPSVANGADPPPREDAFLSEYALARIKQRNGLLEYVPPSDDKSNGSLPPPSLENTEQVTHKLKKGEHLWGVLRRYEDDERERRLWLTSLSRHRAVRRLRTGSDINFYFKTPGNGAQESNGNGNHTSNGNGAGHLQALQIALRSDLRLTWYRNEDGIRFYKDEVPYQQEVRAISGVIRNGSLYQQAQKAGADLAVISRMVDILGWDVNFQRDIQPGDSYRVLYRRKYRAGHPEADRIQILAAEVVNAGRTHTAVYFEDAVGKGHYYDANGRSVSRSFLRYPVEFRRISSRFSASRFHPVLKVRRPHYGVDFAARTGTPIRAAADGRITYRGWKGGYGRLVEISHGGAMKTRYAHLRRYGPGIRRGVSVQKGQTIGYVGCSGLCTGPHLHYEMWQDNRYVDPLRANIPVERQLDPLLLEIFKGTRHLFFERLENGHKSATAPTPRPS